MRIARTAVRGSLHGLEKRDYSGLVERLVAIQ